MENVKNKENKGFTDFDSLITKLKAKDAEALKSIRNLMIIGILVVVIIANNLFGKELTVFANQKIDLAIGVIAGGYLFYIIWQFFNRKRVNYALPIKNTLDLAEKRFRFLNNKFIVEFVLGVLVSTVLGYIFVVKVFTALSLIPAVLLSGAIVIAIMCISVYRSYRLWNMKYKDVWLMIKGLLKELE